MLRVRLRVAGHEQSRRVDVALLPARAGRAPCRSSRTGATRRSRRTSQRVGTRRPHLASSAAKASMAAPCGSRGPARARAGSEPRRSCTALLERLDGIEEAAVVGGRRSRPACRASGCSTSSSARSSGGSPGSTNVARILPERWPSPTPACSRDFAASADRSDGEALALTGSDAKTFLQGQVTNDIEGLEPGRAATPPSSPTRARCSATCVCWTSGTSCCSTPSASRCRSLQHDPALQAGARRRAAQAHAGDRAALAHRAGRAADRGREDLVEEHRNRHAEIAGVPVVLVATDVGIDVFAPAESKETVIAELGVPAVDAEAAEVLRVERGRPRYGVDLDESVIPQEAGLNERAVSFTKGYVGRRRSRGCTTAASRTAICAGCGCRRPPRPATCCGSATSRSGGSGPSRSRPVRPDRARAGAPRGGARRHACGRRRRRDG